MIGKNTHSYIPMYVCINAMLINMWQTNVTQCRQISAKSSCRTNGICCIWLCGRAKRKAVEYNKQYKRGVVMGGGVTMRHVMHLITSINKKHTSVCIQMYIHTYVCPNNAIYVQLETLKALTKFYFFFSTIFY